MILWKNLEEVKIIYNFATVNITNNLLYNHNKMIKFKEYKTREELRASFEKMIKMREEYETRVRQKVAEMEAAGLI